MGNNKIVENKSIIVSTMIKCAIKQAISTVVAQKLLYRSNSSSLIPLVLDCQNSHLYAKVKPHVS